MTRIGESLVSTTINSLKPDITYLGRLNWRNDTRKFGIYDSDNLFQLVLGATGCGKTEYIYSQIYQTLLKTDDSGKPHGVCVIEPHGTLIKKIVDTMPEYRKKDVVLLDMANPDHTIGYNVFKKTSKNKQALVCSNFLETLERLAGTQGWGVKQEHLLRQIILTLLSIKRETNIADVLRLLRDNAFKKECVQELEDEYLLEFWNKEFKQYNPRFDFAPLYNKISGYLVNPSVRKILVENEDNLSISKVMREGKILLISCDRSVVGVNSAHLIGSVMLQAIIGSAFNRLSLPEEERTPFHVFVDEAGFFTNDSMATAWDQLRKTGVRWTLVGQVLDQFSPRLRASIFGNISCLTVFRTSAIDALYLINQLEWYTFKIETADLINLKNYQAWCKMNIRGQPSKVFSMKTELLHNLLPTDSAGIPKESFRSYSS